MKNFIKSFHYAVSGIFYSLQQRNFKIQLLIAAITVFLGVFFQISQIEWCIILICITLVLSLEMLNTAIEKLVDSFCKGYNGNAKIIKDVAAGAVLITAITSAIIGVLVFKNYVLNFMHAL